jgi:phosphopantothenoylcysteine decarboxylase/phosphopantothenate--cysteine ligase
MREAVMEHFTRATVVIKAAAVADYRCKSENCQKIKKRHGEEGITLDLSRNPDILAELGENKGKRIIVGFAAESNALIEHATEKLQKKNLDMIVANDITQSGIGFASDENEVTLIDSAGRTRHVPRLPKDEVASIILDAVKKVIKKKRKVEDDWY